MSKKKETLGAMQQLSEVVGLFRGGKSRKFSSWFAASGVFVCFALSLVDEATWAAVVCLGFVAVVTVAYLVAQGTVDKTDKEGL